MRIILLQLNVTAGGYREFYRLCLTADLTASRPAMYLVRVFSALWTGGRPRGCRILVFTSGVLICFTVGNTGTRYLEDVDKLICLYLYHWAIRRQWCGEGFQEGAPPSLPLELKYRILNYHRVSFFLAFHVFFFLTLYKCIARITLIQSYPIWYITCKAVQGSGSVCCLV